MASKTKSEDRKGKGKSPKTSHNRANFQKKETVPVKVSPVTSTKVNFSGNDDEIVVMFLSKGMQLQFTVASPPGYSYASEERAVFPPEHYAKLQRFSEPNDTKIVNARRTELLWEALAHSKYLTPDKEGELLYSANPNLGARRILVSTARKTAKDKKTGAGGLPVTPAPPYTDFLPKEVRASELAIIQFQETAQPLLDVLVISKYINTGLSPSGNVPSVDPDLTKKSTIETFKHLVQSFLEGFNEHAQTTPDPVFLHHGKIELELLKPFLRWDEEERVGLINFGRPPQRKISTKWGDDDGGDEGEAKKPIP